MWKSSVVRMLPNRTKATIRTLAKVSARFSRGSDVLPKWFKMLLKCLKELQSALAN